VPGPTSTSDAQDYLRTLLVRYDTYHNQKERNVYVAAALHVSGMTVLLVNPPAWPPSLPGMAFPLLAIGGAGLLALVFVTWQLAHRRMAADMSLACTSLATAWLTRPPEVAALTPAPSHGGSMPLALVEEYERFHARPQPVLRPVLVIHLAIVAWTVAAMARALLALG
jgi:hypothetical protein